MENYTAFKSGKNASEIYNSTDASAKARVSAARKIFSKKLNIEALEIITQSNVDSKIKDMAAALLKNESAMQQ